MATKMKAAVVHVLGEPLSIEEVPVPIPGPGEVLVKVIACRVCHTDVHAADGDWPVKPSAPFIPGHEAAGVIAALGPQRDRPQGGRSGRRRLAARCLHELRVLRDRLGDTV